MARIEIFARRGEVLDARTCHEEVGRLLQPVGHCAVGIEPLPVMRAEHFLCLEGLVDVGKRSLAVVSFLQCRHRVVAVCDDVIIGIGKKTNDPSGGGHAGSSCGYAAKACTRPDFQMRNFQNRSYRSSSGCTHLYGVVWRVSVSLIM
jgi:hypothetical protein